MPNKAAPLPEQTTRARFEALWRAHYTDVLGYSLRRLGDEAAAADLTSETFTVAWRRFGFAPDPSRAWLLAIARNLLANQRRGDRRRAALIARVRLERPPADPAHGPEPDERLASAFNSLSNQDREVLSLVTWHELTPTEAAEVLGMSAGRFSVRLHRAKARLRKRLERAGHPTAVAREPNAIRLEAK
jgi:RNA polymerase sigma-70 factor (ECF subfamily)